MLMEQAQTMDVSHLEPSPVSGSQLSPQFNAVMNSEHWLKGFMTNLLAAHQSPAGLDFKTAEALLARERATYEGEVAVAMRIFRTYPHLFQHDNASHSASA
jgi:hypothetical protein